MSLGPVPPARCEGSRRSVSNVKVSADQPDLSKYHETAEGTKIPHRLNDYGSMPGVDPNAPIESQFTVVDYDGDTVVNVSKPGEQQGEEECPNSEKEESSMKSPDSSPPRKRQRRTPTAELQTSVEKLSQKLETTTKGLKDSIQVLQSYLQSNVMASLSSLEKNQESLDAQTKTTSHFRHPIDDGWKVTFRGVFGDITVEPVVVELRSEHQIVMLYDPDKPSFVPARSEELVGLVMRFEDKEFTEVVRPNGWSANLLLGDKDYILVILSIASEA